MRILWSEATSGPAAMDPLWQALEGYFPKVARADTEVVLRHVAVSGNYVRSLYTELLNNRAIVETAIQGEKEGFDAVVIGCWADPLWEAREVFKNPGRGDWGRPQCSWHAHWGTSLPSSRSPLA